MMDMNILDKFIREFGLRPADVVVVKKEFFGILDHYIIYLGKAPQGKHVFIANTTTGIRFIPEWELIDSMKVYKPTRIRRFNGNDFQRTQAVKRALEKKDVSSYNLILNNCEHFANYVQEGKSWSSQSQVAGGIGLGLLFLGLIALISSSNDDDKNNG